MKKKTYKLMLLTSSVCLLPIILSIILYSRLPSEIPIHFNMEGQADNYVSKAIACFLLPLVFVVLNLFVHFMLSADPKRENASEAMKTISRWIVPILSVICIPISLFISIGISIPIHIIIPALVGVVVIICGNYLPKSRQNYTVGIRLPWTLNNVDNWNKTHRMAGFLWIAGGFIITITSLFQIFNVTFILVVVSILVIVPSIYSYILYRRGL